MDELHDEVRKGKRNKAPSPDDMPWILQTMWDIIINTMYLEGAVSEAQKHSHIVRLQKEISHFTQKTTGPQDL